MIGYQLERTIRLGVKSLALHKLRSALTVLGIVFGVCSVIAMLSIGEGAKWEAEQQIKELGSRNVIIQAVKPPADEGSTRQTSRVIQYGLTYVDYQQVRAIPSVEAVVPLRIIRHTAWCGPLSSDVRIVATVPMFPLVANARLRQGRFIVHLDMAEGANSCVLGDGVARKLFPIDSPVGKAIKIKGKSYRVVGVMEKGGGATGIGGGIAQEDRNADVYIALTAGRKSFGEVLSRVVAGTHDMERIELHEMIVSVVSEDRVAEAANAIRHLFKWSHKKSDYQVTVPLELLEQAARTQRIFSIVLGSIAAISLLVGGIGIMNIMLASITERTREIGIRRALGAKRRDIITQFLVETVVLSTSGGLVGMAAGVIIPLMVQRFTHMKTIITPHSLVLAFGISASVGVIFGLYPASRAANMDPIEALRRE